MTRLVVVLIFLAILIAIGSYEYISTHKIEGFRTLDFGDIMENVYCTNVQCDANDVIYENGVIRHVPCEPETCHVLEANSDGTTGYRYVEQPLERTRAPDGACMSTPRDATTHCDITPPVCEGTDTCGGVGYRRVYNAAGMCAWHREDSGGRLTSANDEYMACKSGSDTPSPSPSPTGSSSSSATLSATLSATNGCSTGSFLNDQYGGVCTTCPSGMTLVNPQGTSIETACEDTPPVSCPSEACWTDNQDGTYVRTLVPMTPSYDRCVSALTPECEPRCIDSMNQQSRDVCVLRTDCEGTPDRECYVDGRFRSVETDASCRMRTKDTFQTVPTCIESCPSGKARSGNLCVATDCTNVDTRYTLANGNQVSEDVWNNWETYRDVLPYCDNMIIKTKTALGSDSCIMDGIQMGLDRINSDSKAATPCTPVPCTGQYKRVDTRTLPTCGSVTLNYEWESTGGDCTRMPSTSNYTYTSHTDCPVCIPRETYSIGMNANTWDILDTLDGGSSLCGNTYERTVTDHINAPCLDVATSNLILTKSSPKRETKSAPGCTKPCGGMYKTDESKCYTDVDTLQTCGSGYRKNVFEVVSRGDGNCPSDVLTDISCIENSGCGSCFTEDVFEGTNYDTSGFTLSDFDALPNNVEMCGETVTHMTVTTSNCVLDGTFYSKGQSVSTSVNRGPPCEIGLEVKVEENYIKITCIAPSNVSLRVFVSAQGERTPLPLGSKINDTSNYTYMVDKQVDHDIQVDYKASYSDVWYNVSRTITANEIAESVMDVAPICQVKHTYYEVDESGRVKPHDTMNDGKWDLLSDPLKASKDPTVCGKRYMKESLVQGALPCQKDAESDFLVDPYAGETSTLIFSNRTSNISYSDVAECSKDCEFETQEVEPCRPACGNSTKQVRTVILSEPENNGAACPNTDVRDEACLNYELCPSACEFHWEHKINGTPTNAFGSQQITAEEVRRSRDHCGRSVESNKKIKYVCKMNGIIQTDTDHVYRTVPITDTACYDECAYGPSEFKYENGTSIPITIDDTMWDTLESNDTPAICEQNVVRKRVPTRTPCYTSEQSRHLDQFVEETKTGAPCPVNSSCEPNPTSSKIYVSNNKELSGLSERFMDIHYDVKSSTPACFNQTGIKNIVKRDTNQSTGPVEIYKVRPYRDPSCTANTADTCPDGSPKQFPGLGERIDCTKKVRMC